MTLYVCMHAFVRVSMHVHTVLCFKVLLHAVHMYKCVPSCLLRRSESPSQVFLITVSFLYEVLKDKPETEWKDIILAYDNMCHLDALKVANAPLPLPAPYCDMWSKVTNIIDSLHTRNHVDKRCLEKYHPRSVKERFPKFNLMAAEQTFVWASRFKKVLCSMPKTHHCFFLHRWACKFHLVYMTWLGLP